MMQPMGASSCKANEKFAVTNGVRKCIECEEGTRPNEDKTECKGRTVFILLNKTTTFSDYPLHHFPDCDAKKVYPISFTLKEIDLSRLNGFAEEYVMSCLGTFVLSTAVPDFSLLKS
jgi:hypothetical protein